MQTLESRTHKDKHTWDLILTRAILRLHSQRTAH